MIKSFLPQTVLLILTTVLAIAPVKAQAINRKQAKEMHKDNLQTINIWPASFLVKNSGGNKTQEYDKTKPEDAKPDGKPVIRLTGISNPTIKIYAPANPNGTAVVVCPGGGYSILALDLEGEEICTWLNSLGVTAILLKYRVPATTGMLNYEAPLQDAQRALGLVRYNAGKWHIKPDHIGILGFSAGGHLSAALSNNYSKRTYTPVDDADTTSCRPDFAVLVYPAYLADKKEVGKLAPEIQVTGQTPPTFLMQTEDDGVGVENSLYYFLALKQAKVPAEMHLYARGGHGYGLRNNKGGTSVWPKLVEKWLHENGR